jgi:hypothetical protein
MRDPLHVCNTRRALGLALVGAVLMAVAPVPAAGKVLRPQVADRIDDPGVIERPTVQVQVNPSPAAETVQKAETAQKAESGTSTARPAKGKADPNTPEPLSERAAAAAERAKRALSDEDFGELDADPVAVGGQPAAASQGVKSAATLKKPEAKCLAGC